MESVGTGPQSPADPPSGPQSPAPGPESLAPSQVPPGGWEQPMPAVPYKFAGWWSRVGAAIIDWLVVGIPTTVVIVGLGIGALSSDDGTWAFIGGLGVTALVAIAIGLLYAPILMAREGAQNGRTWGKQATGIRVVRANGTPIDFGFAALREIVVKGILFNAIGGSFFFPWVLNYLWPLWDDQNRALHDMVVDTRVIEA